jgi:hypothetical protein
MEQKIMHYNIYGGYELPRTNKRVGNFNKGFWSAVNNQREGLSKACGCYVFALRNGDNIKPWYVGKAEKQCFADECFSPHKQNIFNKVLLEKNGTPLLYFIARLTPSDRLCKPTLWKYEDVRFLETLLIGTALGENPELANTRKTKHLRTLHVPGIINSRQASPTLPVRELRNALGLSQ